MPLMESYFLINSADISPVGVGVQREQSPEREVFFSDLGNTKEHSCWTAIKDVIVGDADQVTLRGHWPNDRQVQDTPSASLAVAFMRHAAFYNFTAISGGEEAVTRLYMTGEVARAAENSAARYMIKPIDGLQDKLKSLVKHLQDNTTETQNILVYPMENSVSQTSAKLLVELKKMGVIILPILEFEELSAYYTDPEDPAEKQAPKTTTGTGEDASTPIQKSPEAQDSSALVRRAILLGLAIGAALGTVGALWMGTTDGLSPEQQTRALELIEKYRPENAQ